MSDPADLEKLRLHLGALEAAIQARVLDVRDGAGDLEELAEVDAVTPADTIYRIDRVGEEVVLEWLDAHWPEEWPAELVMEGQTTSALFPKSGKANGSGREPRLVCIVDPIDGTRGLMVDKRSAWVLAALAPHPAVSGAEAARLCDIQVAAMTELPPTKQRLADQLSAVRGSARGVHALRIDVDSRRAHVFRPRPSKATDLLHGFASITRFFSAEKECAAEIERRMLERLYGERLGWPAEALVFDDQYLSTGGQFYELLCGRDRMLADLRPLIHRHLGIEGGMSCHPYDACTALLLEEAGCVVETPDGGALDAPLDLESPVAWQGFANAEIAKHVRPALGAAIEEVLGRPAS